VGNIILGSCITTIANIAEEKIVLKLPQVTNGMTKEFFFHMVTSHKEIDHLILVKNSLSLADEPVYGLIFILFSFDDFKIVLDRLSSKVKE